jgi:hypothetical protein
MKPYLRYAKPDPKEAPSVAAAFIPRWCAAYIMMYSMCVFVHHQLYVVSHFYAAAVCRRPALGQIVIIQQYM